jgi:hypothetical protein
MAAYLSLVLLLGWVYLASCFVEDSFYNLLVNRVRTALFRPVTGLQRLSPRLSEKAAAGLLVLLALAVCATVPRILGKDPELLFGNGMSLFAPRTSFPGALALQTAAFLILLGQLALLRLAFALRGRAADGALAEFLETATWPLPRRARPAVVAASAAGLLLAGGALAAWGAGDIAFFRPHAPQDVLGSRALPVWLALLGAIDLLRLARWALLACCLLSWAVFLSPRARGVSEVANLVLQDLMRLLLGGRDLAVGLVSFGPLLLWWVLGLVHLLLAGLVL